MWESKSITLYVIVFSKPFNMLKEIINVATPKAIPDIVITEIKEMNLDSLREKIYFLAIKKEKDIYVINYFIIPNNLIKEYHKHFGILMKL